MRSLWKGSISFGLINIPVVMYSGSEERSVDLDMLRKSDHAKIQFKKVAADTDEEVAYEDIVRGYKLESGKYVILEKEDLEAVEAEQTHTMDIVSFVKSEEIDSVYFDKPFYLEPSKGADKAYALLLTALKKSDRVALAKMVMRTKEQIGILKAERNLIIFNRMRYPDEIRDSKELKIPKDLKVSDKESALALKLVEQLTEPFKPEGLKDTYKEKLEKFIKNKEKKHDTVKVSEPEATHVDELMAQLEKSLKSSRGSKRAAMLN
jgi:DNA end-binding protein Ku